MPIPHTLMATLFQIGAPHIHILSQSTTILLVVRSAKNNGSTLTSKASYKINLLNDDLLMSLCVSSLKSAVNGIK